MKKGDVAIAYGRIGVADEGVKWSVIEWAAFWDILYAYEFDLVELVPTGDDWEGLVPFFFFDCRCFIYD